MERKKSIRVGLIGCGFYAQNHLNAWKHMKARGVELVSVCDLDKKKAERAATSFGTNFYTNADKMLASEELDLIDIVTQAESHKQLSFAVLEKGLAAIVQKPFAPTLPDCIEIVDKAKSCAAWLAVHENFRFSHVMRCVKEIILNGEIGDLNWGRLTFRTGFDIYKNQPYLAREKRFSILDSGIHILDLARFFFGEVDRLSCETQRRNPNVVGEDTATMLLRHDTGAVTIVETTYESKRLPDYFPQTLLEIEGSSGSIILKPGQVITVTTKDRSYDRVIETSMLPWFSKEWCVSQEAVLNTNLHLLDCYRQGVEAEISGRDNLNTFALVEAAYEAASSNRSVQPLRFSR